MKYLTSSFVAADIVSSFCFAGMLGGGIYDGMDSCLSSREKILCLQEHFFFKNTAHPRLCRKGEHLDVFLLLVFYVLKLVMDEKEIFFNSGSENKIFDKSLAKDRHLA